MMQNTTQVCPLEDLCGTNSRVKSTQVRSVEEPDIPDL